MYTSYSWLTDAELVNLIHIDPNNTDVAREIAQRFVQYNGENPSYSISEELDFLRAENARLERKLSLAKKAKKKKRKAKND